MASEMLNKVLAAEKTGGDALAKACEQADASLEKARADSHKIIAEKKKAAHLQASQAVEAAEEKAKAIERAAADSAGGEAAKIKAVAESKSDAAVAALISQII